MSINITQSPFKSTAPGATTSRTFGDRWADVINVLDYGADSTGTNPSGAAIQAAFDAAYGPAGSSNTDNGQSWLNKAVYIPGGTYLIDQQLFLNHVEGARVYGNGQKQTILKYTGPASKNVPTGDFTPILACRTVTYSEFQGITFDATGSNADVCVSLINWDALQNDGTGDSWIDCGFVGATSEGFLTGHGGSGQDGSEQYFVGCTFDGCGGPGGFGGLRTAGSNALDVVVVGCRFVNNTTGISSVLGGVQLVLGCSFHSNSVIDVWVKQAQQTPTVGCVSDSDNFLCVGGWIAGCTHTGVGYFWDLYAGGNNGGNPASDNPQFIAEACKVPSSAINGTNANTAAYLRGNSVGANFLSVMGSGSVENI